MESAIAAGSAIRIRRVRAEYFISAEHANPSRLRAALDEAARRELPDAIAACLTARADEANPSLWFIRRLELDVDVNGSWGRDRVAAEWAGQLTRALTQAIREPTSDGNVVWFPNRAAYLAHFLVDVAAGRASNRWYYRPFDGLRLLPSSAIARTALCDAPSGGLAALQQLEDDELRAVLKTLSRHDARRVLEALSGAGDRTSSEADCADAAWTAWRGHGVSRFDDEPAEVLRVFVRAAGRRPDLVGRTLASSTAALVRLARCFAECSNDRAEALIEALTRGSVAELYSLLDAPSVEVLRPLLRRTPDWLREVARQCVPAAHATNPPDASPIAPRHTAFGGMFLLLPMLNEFPHVDATRNWPGAEGTTAEPIVRLLLLARCSGRARAEGVFGDPLTRELSGIPPDMPVRSLRDWQKAVSPRHVARFVAATNEYRRNLGVSDLTMDSADDIEFLTIPESLSGPPWLDEALGIAAATLMRAFARRLPGFASSTLLYLYRNFLDFAATLEEEPERRVARLRRPPLHLVLALTGLTRATYRLKWLDDRPFTLFQDE